ncbi:hypothetical protein I6E09_13235 [Mediterraneibacter glycyrrhizinilyticus]|uniref:hypothetical protein n=1 Tax=Mediterraneibacter glycyrrhizinilyticus TaxID=342942 RepID=UPI00265B57F1|nr:hypothetical protein [Mediterraneibacter glycyrrhizinilyticus]MCF2570124.1 hypothetical protein [Mediterraneibacter glycyrrhizinilyticus]
MSELADRYRISQLVEQQKNGAKKKKLRWNTATQVRRSLARINNWVANGEITAKEANAIYYSANLILKALELESK